VEWLWAIVLLGAGCAIWGIFIERYLFVVRRDAVAVLPPNSKPIRVLHISDFHLAPWQRRKMKFIKSLAELKADLVIDTGDNLGHAQAIDSLLNSTAELRKTPGVFVNGSNDYHTPTFRNPLSYLFKPSTPTHSEKLETEKMTDAFESTGWLNLNNRSGQITIGDTKIGFLGLDDPHDGLADYSSLNEQSSEVRDHHFVIGVSHAPYLQVLEGMASSGADILFAGHTHGGQVRLPLIGALVTNCDLPRNAARGLTSWHFSGRDLWLNVCAGLGTSIFAPIRFFCRPEVRLIELQPRKQA
jgi:predicted MPP superfamily phosphohydrolase